MNRYDGIGSKIYRHDVRNPNSPTSNRIRSMTLNGKGNIWMATDGALTKYIPATDSFRNYFVSTRSNNHSTSSPYIDYHNVIWFGNDDGLCRLNANRKIETFPIEHLMQRFGIGFIIEDDRGTTWIGTIQGGLSSFNKD